MRRPRLLVLAMAGALTLVGLGSAAAGPNTDRLVTTGSPQEGFSQNKQNEPQIAVNWVNPDILVAGANDNIDLELCPAGDPTTCPFTAGVGLTGVTFSTDGGRSWTQPTYTGWSARHCTGPAECEPRVGPIGTLPRYHETGLVSSGDPAMVWGPAPDGDGGFSWDRQRLYFANLTGNFSAEEPEFRGPTAIGVSRLDSDRLQAAVAGDDSAWMRPVIVTQQSQTTFSDKEEIWADNVESSPYFGHVYVCNVAFRSSGAAPEPLMVATSTDGGDTWRQRQITPATNTAQTGGRQGCTIRTDSKGVVYVFFAGFDIRARTPAMLMARSFDGGANFERARVVATTVPVGRFDPNQGRLTFDGLGGARTATFPSIDIANGAPYGTARGGPAPPDTIALTHPMGPTPSDSDPGPNETAPVLLSRDGGGTFQTLVSNAAAPGDRPNFPAVGISPDGEDVYVVYDNHGAPWQSTTSTPRPMQGVVRHIELTSGDVRELHRGQAGDVRGSSANSLAFGFIGDYNYVVATNELAAAVWNDVRDAQACPAVDAYRQALADGLDAQAPAPASECSPRFGNTDIYGGVFADPSR